MREDPKTGVSKKLVGPSEKSDVLEHSSAQSHGVEAGPGPNPPAALY
jgi:hypothetical protein